MKQLVVSLLLAAAIQPVSTAMVAPRGVAVPKGYEAVPLGQVRVTHYTHHECRSRVTASGYVLKDSDQGRVCAVSRDLWRGRVKPGELVFIQGQEHPCVARDSMADHNRKGFKQRRWLDVYYTDRQDALDFGIKRATAYVLKRRA
jgi:3D (Asp-Asp-Asp) domain-containing protein